MGSFSVDASIISQVAAKIAGDLTVAGIISLSDMEQVQKDIFNSTLALSGAESVVEVIDSVGNGARGNKGGGRPQGQRSSGGNASGSLDPTEAGNTELKGGKYAGKTVNEVIAEDRDYAEWFAESGQNEFMAKRFASALAVAA